MKKLIRLIIVLLLPVCVSAQTDSSKVTVIQNGIPPEIGESTHHIQFATASKNALYAELLGNGFAYSLNYERLIYGDERLGLSARIGIAPGFINLFKGFGLPLEVNAAFLRRKGHMAEMGAGFAWFYGKSRYRNADRELVTTGFYNVCDVNLRIGYKYCRPEGGFLFRAAFLPTFAVISPAEVRGNDFFPFGKVFTPWAGISVGYAFKNK